MNEQRSEIKTGFFVLVVLAALFVLTFRIGRFQTGKTQTFQAVFSYAGGLKKDAPVYVSGVEQGKVSSIEIQPGKEAPVVVTVELKQTAQVFKDGQAWIDSVGFLGDKIVEIDPGKTNEVLAPGAVIPGVDPIPTQKLLLKLDQMANHLDVMMTSLTPLITRMDQVTSVQREEIEKMIANFYQVSANLRDMTHDLKYRPWRLLRKG